jgi:hypothetical protein
MNVAWQFTAWKQLEKAFRPVRDGMIVVRRSAHDRRIVTECHIEPNHTVYETAFSLASFQAVNCQATLIKSLRDKNASCPLGPHSPAIGRRPLLVSSMY